jgi:hypothetical protein
LLIGRNTCPAMMPPALSQARSAVAGQHGPSLYGIALTIPSPCWPVFERGSMISIRSGAQATCST